MKTPTLNKILAAEEEHFHLKDELLSGFDYDELVMTVISNHPAGERSAKIKETFEDLLAMKIADANHSLEKHMADIVEAIEDEVKGY